MSRHTPTQRKKAAIVAETRRHGGNGFEVLRQHSVSGAVASLQQPLGAGEFSKRVVTGEVLGVQRPAKPLLKTADTQTATLRSLDWRHARGCPDFWFNHVDFGVRADALRHAF